MPAVVLDRMALERARAEASERALDEHFCELLALEGTDSALGFDWLVEPTLIETAPAPGCEDPAYCGCLTVIELDELRAAERDPRVIAGLRRAREVGEHLEREGRIHW